MMTTWGSKEYTHAQIRASHSVLRYLMLLPLNRWLKPGWIESGMTDDLPRMAWTSVHWQICPVH